MKRILVIALVLMAINISAYCQKDNKEAVKVNILNKDKSINTDTLSLGKPLAAIHKNKSFENISNWAKAQTEKGYTVALSKEEDGTYVAKSYRQNEYTIIKKEE